MKYMIIVFFILFTSCGSSEVGNSKNSNDLCKDYKCFENQHCVVKNLNATCECDDNYIFSPADSKCIKQEADLCVNNQCTDNEECNISTGNCDCKEGFIKENNICINQKIVKCKAVAPQNGINNIVDIEINYLNNSWEDIPNCEWVCKENYEKQNEECILKPQKHAVMIYGDNRDHETTVHGYPIKIDSKHPRVVSAMMREINSNPNHIKYIFNSGDLVWDGNDPENDEWNDFFNEIKPFIDANITYYPVLGNHEHESINYFNNFDLPEAEKYYHVDLYGVRFLALDSNSDLTEGSEQRDWLIDKLDNLPADIKFVVAIYHHPTFSTGHHGDDGDKKELRNILHPLFVEKGVDLVFNGHDHAYEHLEADGITYIVTGGGGAILDQTRLSIGDYNYSKKFEGRKYHYCLLTIENDKLTIQAKEATEGNPIFDTIVINSHR